MPRKSHVIVLSCLSGAMKAMRKTLPILALLPLLAGCGGGSGGSATPAPARGTATVRIAWPPSEARFVPASAKSVVVTLLKNGTPLGTRTIARPDSSTTFDGLAYTAYEVSIAAYPTADGTGTAQATGNAQMRVTEDAPGSASVSLATTVAAIGILPIQIDKRTSTDVRITATDGGGATVLLSTDAGSEQVAWTVDAPTVAQVEGTGPTTKLTGLHSGTTTVRASLSLGSTVLTSTAPVTINVVNDGAGTVTVS